MRGFSARAREGKSGWLKTNQKWQAILEVRDVKLIKKNFDK